jgi:hypothetical protein
MVTKIFWNTLTTGTAQLFIQDLDTVNPEKQVMAVLKTRAPIARFLTRLVVTSECTDGSYVEITFHTAIQ